MLLTTLILACGDEKDADTADTTAGTEVFIEAELDSNNWFMLNTLCKLTLSPPAGTVL